MARKLLLQCALVTAALPFLALEPATAQPADPKFGMEFEFAGKGNRIVNFDDMSFNNYKKLMRAIVSHYGGDPSTIKRVDFMKPTSNLEKFPSGERPLFRAEWKDPRGRTWLIEPEFVASTGFDGYELVTPPMKDSSELRGILEKIQATGLVRQGRRSGVHLTVDATKLIKPNGDARALSNLILMHENAEPMLRRIFNPVRGGGHANYFARSLAVDHEDLLKEIDALPPEARTKAKLESLFNARNGRELTLQEADPMDPNSMNKLWKYRSMNLAKALNVNPLHSSPVPLVEFRMFDLAEPETHELQSKLYRRMIRRAGEMAEAGETVKYKPRAEMPVGENPSIYNTPEDPTEAKAKAREFIESLGLESSEFDPLLERTIKARDLRTPSEFKGMLDALPEGKIMHNGKAMTYGFELEGRGDGLTKIARPTDAATDARWDSMSDSERRAYYNEKVGQNHSSVKSHFKLDTAKNKWLNDYWYVEGSGNWEIHSNVQENLKAATDAMATAKELTGKSAKGFHLHMRDNAPDWEKLEAKGSEYADFVKRAGNWVYLKRVERLRTDLSLKSWSNARMSTGEVDLVANMEETDRATLRVAGVNRNADGTGYIDMEIRGFTKSVEDIHTLAKIFSYQYKNQEFGKWKHTDNPMESEAWGGAPKGLEYKEHYEEYMRDVVGKKPTAEKLRIIEGLQESWAEKAGGDTRAYATGVATPLLNWENEKSLPEEVRRDAKFAKEEFLGWLDRYADRIQSGEFGVDLKYANETALIEGLGLSEAAAKAIVAARAGGGELTTEDALREIAIRGGATAADLAKLDRLGAIDVDRATKAELKDRLGLTDAEAKKIENYRDAHTLEESLRFARVGAERRTTMEARAKGLDIGDASVDAEKIKSHTGIDLDAAKAIVAYRDAHSVLTEADWKNAGLDADEIEEMKALPTGEGVNLQTATEAELIELGLTESQAKKIVAARKANALQTFNDVVNKVGLSEAAKTKLRTLRTLANLNSLTAEELVEKTGITDNQARKLVNYRDAMTLDSEAKLAEILGNPGRRLYRKAVGVDLAMVGPNDLVNAGLDSEVARKLIDYRDANLLGRNTPGAAYDAELAAEKLYYDADIIDYEVNEKIEELTKRTDLSRADADDLRRLGLTENQARKTSMYRDANSIAEAGVEYALEEAGLTEARAEKAASMAEILSLQNASVEEIMARTGLSRAKSKKLHTLGTLDLESATLEELRAGGLSEANARELIEARGKLARLEGIDYKTAVRKLRLKVRKWVRDSNISEHLLRSLLPKVDVNVVAAAEGEAEGFGRTRRGMGPFKASKMSLETVGGVFGSVRDATLERLAGRFASAQTPGEKANIKAAIDKVIALQLDVIETNDVRAEIGEGRVRVSTGLLNQIHARGEELPPGRRPFFRARVLGLILAHEGGHATGFKGEKMADLEGLKILEAANGLGTIEGQRIGIETAEIRGALESFDKPLGSSHIDNLLNRLRGMFRYGRARERRIDLERAATGEEVDKLARFRRADGTVKWKEFSRNKLGTEALGVVHFGMALFLKELAVVARTGDRARIEEFFDGLMTTDFYKEYGLFVVGARVGEVAYVKYLQSYVKPKFLNGILKSNLVLGAGLALPMIVHGTFEGKAFAISLGSLGISSTAVHGASKSIKWLIDLRKAKTAGTAARTGLAMSRFMRAGAWFYTAAELAVILYVAEDLEIMVNGYLDRKAAKAAVADAGVRFLEAINDPAATAASVRSASDDYDKEFTKFRDYLYMPLYEDEAIYASRVEKAAREAKILDDRNTATIDKVKDHAALKRNIERRFGSIEAYAKHLSATKDKELQADMDMYSKSYNKAREGHLEEVYNGNKREGTYLGDLANRDWLLAGGKADAPGDPYANSAVPLYGNLARRRARGRLHDALSDVSFNRLESYADEKAALLAAQALLKKQGRNDLAAALNPSIDVLDRIADADNRLAHGSGGIIDVQPATGAAALLEGAGKPGPR